MCESVGKGSAQGGGVGVGTGSCLILLGPQVFSFLKWVEESSDVAGSSGVKRLLNLRLVQRQESRSETLD